MTAPSVTFTGEEVAIVASLIAGTLPQLDESDFEVADLLLDRALAVLPRPLPPDLAARIERLRIAPLDRFWSSLSSRAARGVPFSVIDASLLGEVRPSLAFLWLEKLVGRKPDLRRVDDHHWMIDVKGPGHG